jgi:hypothetical protein
MGQLRITMGEWSLSITCEDMAEVVGAFGLAPDPAAPPLPSTLKLKGAVGESICDVLMRDFGLKPRTLPLPRKRNP